MVNKLRKMLRNEKGFTLVELLAVIVILGIIGAIAVPSIAGVIENSKKDAHIANAQSLLEAARLYDVSDDIENTGGTVKYSTLKTNGFIDEIDAPSGSGAYDDDSEVDLDNNKVILYDDGTNNKFLEGKPQSLTKNSVTLNP